MWNIGSGKFWEDILMGYLLFILAWRNVSTELVQRTSDLSLIYNDAIYKMEDIKLGAKRGGLALLPFYLLDGNKPIVESKDWNKERMLIHFCSYKHEIFCERFDKEKKVQP